MPLRSFKATDFRCLESAAAELDPQTNLIVGPNAAGKTSILEALGYLGRGKSFLGAPTEKLVRHGCREFVVIGESEFNGHRHALGVKNGQDGLETRVDGDAGGGAAALAALLPLQVIGPDVHGLVAAGPEERRKYLDWLGFHVEQPYLGCWRRYRRALKQRNAVLKQGGRPSDLDLWDQELAEAGEHLASLQAAVFELVAPVLESTASELVSGPVGFRLRQGWKSGTELSVALGESRERDRSSGSTQAGPHRLDIVLEYDERRARKLVSRGQQKLLAGGMVLAGVEVVQEVLANPLLLLIDDPAAELDAESLGRLMDAAEGLGCQIVATALTAEQPIFSAGPALFHVEQGRLSPA